MAKILLVEDDNNLREIYEARLQAEGYTIVSAMDGEEALVVAKKEKPDLVISDVMMPRISGFEMLDILRNTDGLKTVKVIMLTALGQAEDKTRADSLGADRYLVKSQVTLEDIVKAAQELLGPADGPAPAPAPTTASPVAPELTPAMPVVPVSTPSVEPTVPAMPMPPAPEPALPSIPATPPVIPVVPPTPAVMPSVPAPTPASEPLAPAVPQTPTPQPNPAPIVPPEPSVTPLTPTPPAASAPSTEPAPMATPQPNEAQSTSAEENAIKAQIESFVSQNNQTAPGTDSAPTPTEPSTTPATAATTPASSDDALMANAVRGLVTDVQDQASTAASGEKTVQPTTSDGNTTMPAPSVVNPTPAAPDTGNTTNESTSTSSNNDDVSVAHKKIISPITDSTAPSQPDLNELLAKEGLAGMGDDQHPDAPNAQNPTGLPVAPHPPGHVISPNPQVNGGVDPNSIAL